MLNCWASTHNPMPVSNPAPTPHHSDGRLRRARSTATTTSASPSTTTNAAPIPMIVVSGDLPYTRTQNASLHDPLFTSMWYQPTPMSLMSLMCNTSVNR